MWVSILVELSQTVERQNPGLFPGPDRGIITGPALRQHFSVHIKKRRLHPPSSIFQFAESTESAAKTCQPDEYCG